jgi:hypothetical protein
MCNLMTLAMESQTDRYFVAPGGLWSMTCMAVSEKPHLVYCFAVERLAESASLPKVCYKVHLDGVDDPKSNTDDKLVARLNETAEWIAKRLRAGQAVPLVLKTEEMARGRV